MKIDAVEVIPYWLPFRADYITARGRLERREMVLLRIVDRDGREGWGEAVPMALRGGADLARVVGDLEAWASHTVGRSFAPRRLRTSPALEGFSAPARCAVETALADLEARRRGIPLWRLLGAERCAPVPCNATLVSGAPEAVAADAERWAEAGFTTFKLKVGLQADGPVGGRNAWGRRRPGPLRDPDLGQIKAVRDAVGDEARIRLDANGAWSIDRAEAVLRAAAPLEIELVEEPVAGLAAMAELRRRLRRGQPKLEGDELGRRRPAPSAAIPVAGDESVNGAADAAAAQQAGACDLATVKLSKVGRLFPDLGDALPFYLSSALDGPVGIAAAAHVFQAIPDPPPLAQGLATQRLFAATIAEQACELKDSFLQLPSGPGLGVTIDSAALAAHRL